MLNLFEKNWDFKSLWKSGNGSKLWGITDQNFEETDLKIDAKEVLNKHSKSKAKQ